MADFVQTMKDWKRMCNAMGQEDEYTACNKCDLRLFGCPAIYEKECDSADWNHVESVVTAWAAEHPEPVYPTWGEWLESEGICFSRLTNNENVHGFTIPKVFEYQIDGKTAFICGDRVNSHIPADIAQKLGLQPKEG